MHHTRAETYTRYVCTQYREQSRVLARRREAVQGTLLGKQHGGEAALRRLRQTRLGGGAGMRRRAVDGSPVSNTPTFGAGDWESRTGKRAGLDTRSPWPSSMARAKQHATAAENPPVRSISAATGWPEGSASEREGRMQSEDQPPHFSVRIPSYTCCCQYRSTEYDALTRSAGAHTMYGCFC